MSIMIDLENRTVRFGSHVALVTKLPQRGQNWEGGKRAIKRKIQLHPDHWKGSPSRLGVLFPRRTFVP